METINELKDLARTRAEVKKNQEVLDKLALDLRDNPLYQEILSAQTKKAELQASQSAIEEKIKNDWKVQFSEKTASLEGEDREKAIKEFRDSLISGLGLRITNFLEYDLAEVTEWCKENAKLLFKLDVKEFEKMADKVNVPGVKKINVPTITIATDLSSYLVQAPAPAAEGEVVNDPQ